MSQHCGNNCLVRHDHYTAYYVEFQYNITIIQYSRPSCIVIVIVSVTNNPIVFVIVIVLEVLVCSSPARASLVPTPNFHPLNLVRVPRTATRQ